MEGRLAVASDRDGARGRAAASVARHWECVHYPHTFTRRLLCYGTFTLNEGIWVPQFHQILVFHKRLSCHSSFVLSSHIHVGTRSPRASEILLESLSARLGLDISFQGTDVLTVRSLCLLPFFVSLLSVALWTHASC